MTDHPMKPTIEQIREWRLQSPNARDAGATREDWIARTAYAAGADAQLELCCEWLRIDGYPGISDCLRAEMRPKPPSLADLAAKDLAVLRRDAERCGLGFSSTRIEAALERLAELEGQVDA